jgi:hypothetical protein
MMKKLLTLLFTFALAMPASAAGAPARATGGASGDAAKTDKPKNTIHNRATHTTTKKKKKPMNAAKTRGGTLQRKTAATQ